MRPMDVIQALEWCQEHNCAIRLTGDSIVISLLSNTHGNEIEVSAETFIEAVERARALLGEEAE
jgi:hypothetical protein